MDFVHLTTTPDESTATIVESMLRAEGIQVEIRIPDVAQASALGTAAGSAARGYGGFRQVYVPSTVIDQARELLDHTGAAVAVTPSAATPAAYVAAGELPVLLHDVRTGDLVGEIDEDDLSLLAGHLEAESDEDVEFYINETTVDALQAAGATQRVLDALRRTLIEGEGDVRWSYRAVSSD